MFEDHTALVAVDVAEARVDTLEEIKALGADTMRIEVHWNEIAPQPNVEDQAGIRRGRPARPTRPPKAYPGLLPVRRPRAPGDRDGLPDPR